MNPPLSTPFRLDGRAILVTGASSGIGRQCCLTIAAQGATVIASGRNAERLQETLSSLTSGSHAAIAADLTDASQLAQLVEKMPVLDGVVHSAGLQKFYPVKFISGKALQETNAVNYEAPILLTQELLKRKLLRKGGSVVFLSSLASHLGFRGNAVYSGSKAALIAVARVMALELAALPVRVNCLAPGIVRTPMAERMSAAFSAEQMQEHEKLYPLGFGLPEDVANAVVFLLADASRWITGQTLILDGGYSCQ